QERDHRLFALLGNDGQLDLALLDIENGVCRIALLKNTNVRLVSRDRSSAVRLVQKRLDVESLGFFGSHRQSILSRKKYPIPPAWCKSRHFPVRACHFFFRRSVRLVFGSAGGAS